MTEAGNMGDTAQPGQGPRAADMGDGALPPAAAEDGGRRPQPQREFWKGRGLVSGSGGLSAVPARLTVPLIPSTPFGDTLSPGHSTGAVCRAAAEEPWGDRGEAYLPVGCLWAAALGPWRPGPGHP